VKAVRPTAEAADEIRAAIVWYENERTGLGRELWEQLDETIHLIAQYPSVGSIVRRARVTGDVRRVPLRRFPYFVVDRERGDSIELVAFAHTSRRPGYWKSRRDR
jgi:hypothetical protein